MRYHLSLQGNKYFFSEYTSKEPIFTSFAMNSKTLKLFPFKTVILSLSRDSVSQK